MKEILIDTPLVSDEDFFVRNRKKKIIISLILFSSLFLFSLFFFLFYYFYIKDVLNQNLLKRAEDEYTPYLDPNDFGFLSKKLIYTKLTFYAIKNDFKIIKGRMKSCGGRCKVESVCSVDQWKLKIISEILEGDKPVDLMDEFDTIKKYNEFLINFGSNYKNQAGFKKNYQIFRKNKERIEKHNKDENRLYDMGYTSFSDVADEDEELSSFNVIQSGEIFSKSLPSLENLSNQEIHVDWRREGVVSPVINQGSCGSCWAIAATDAFSSFMSIKNKQRVTFSYQQVLDCSSGEFTCKGGIHRLALDYIQDSKMCLDGSYPYKKLKSSCSSSKCEIKSEINEIISLSSSTALKFLKNNGPFVTSFSVSSEFLLYSTGIFNGSCRSPYAHSVLVVGHGYDKVLKKNYWIVKNSWGQLWGEQGYFRILDSNKNEDNEYETYCDLLISSYGIV